MFLESILEIEGRDHLAALLLQYFKVAGSILENEAFPKNWLNVNILAHRVLLKMMDPVASMFEYQFVPNEASGRPFDALLWKECFRVLLKLLSSEHLVIEEFSPQVSVLQSIYLDINSFRVAETARSMATCGRHSRRRCHAVAPAVGCPRLARRDCH